jgi:GT2 family glycosyltransferase
VVLVTRDRPAELQRALESVVRSPDGGREIVVVDNGSGDPDAVAAAAAHAAPGARLIRLAANTGVSAARNLGAREARGDVVVFLDDDAEFTDPAGIARAERAFAARPRMGILAARIVREGGRIVRAEFPSRHLWRADAPGRAPYFCGCAFAVRRAAFEALGGFDEAFFFALEELDLSFRAAAQGVEIGYEPGFEALHRPSRSGRESGGWFYHGMRSRCLLARKNLPVAAAMSHMGVWIAYLLVRGVGAGQGGAAVRGLVDGVRDARRARRAPVSLGLLRELGRIGGRSLY